MMLDGLFICSSGLQMAGLLQLSGRLDDAWHVLHTALWETGGTQGVSVLLRYSATVRWYQIQMYLSWMANVCTLLRCFTDACSWKQDVSRLHNSHVSHWFLKCTGHGAGCRVEYFYDQLGTAAPRISNSFSTRKKLSQNIKCTLCSVFIDIIFQSMLWCTI